MKYLVLYNIKPTISQWSKDRADFDLKKCDFSKAPMYERDDGVEVYDARWLLKKLDTIKYDGVIAYVEGDVFKGIWGNHKGTKDAYRNTVKIGDKKISVIQVEHHEKKYREYKKSGLFWKMSSTRKKTKYWQPQYTFDHELTHSLAFLSGFRDLLHWAIKFKNYDGYMEDISKKKITPLKDWHKVSQSYGTVDWELYPKTGRHWGVDHAVPMGTCIYAPCDGFLRKDKSDVKALGTNCYFSFRDGLKLYTLVFAHLYDTEPYGKYKKGDVIAYSGNSGLSTAPHCHTEQWRGLIVDRNRISKLTINPIKYYN